VHAAQWGVARAICILIGPQRHRARPAHSNTQTLLHIPRLLSQAKKIKFRRVPHKSQYHLLSAVSNEIIIITGLGGKNHIVRWWRRHFFYPPGSELIGPNLGIFLMRQSLINSRRRVMIMKFSSSPIELLWAQKWSRGQLIYPIASVGEKMHREDFVVTQNVTGSNYARCCGRRWNGFINKIQRLLS
jgi:hypothetical protein